MDILKILTCLERHKKEEFTCDFLEDTITYFKKLSKTERPLLNIENNEFQLAGIKIYLLYERHCMYLVPEKLNLAKYCTRSLNLTAKQAANLGHQLEGLKNNSFDICGKAKEPQHYTVIIHNKPLPEYKEYVVDPFLQPQFLGIHTLMFLDHQNLANYCKLYDKNKHIFEQLIDIIQKLKKLTPLQKERVFFHSGLIYAFFGVTYTQDIDILILAKSEKEEAIAMFDKLDKAILYMNEAASKEMPYKYQWFMYKLPRLSGSPDLYTSMLNPKYHFYYMGIKCSDVFNVAKRTISRSNAFAFIDIYLLKTIANIDLMDEFCVKNISIRQGKANVITEHAMNSYITKIKKSIHEWYGISIPDDYIKKHFVKCEKKFDTIYREQISYVDPLIKTITYTNRTVVGNYIKKYGMNAKYLLDIGSGKLTGASVYQQAHIKNVYGVEPSIYSINKAKQVAMEKYKNINFTFIHSTAENMPNLSPKFDIITFTFTIHYIIPHLDKVVKHLLTMTKKDTKILVAFVNSENFYTELKTHNKYEVRYKEDIYWGVYNLEKGMHEKATFYMKDVYGLDIGSNEYLVNVNNLIDIFKRNKISMVESTNIFKAASGGSLNDMQKKIVSIHHMLVFNVD